jgi:transcriptional regulator with GAF, ATPase, and Fis domain
MSLHDMDFFHQATMRICGSLDIDTVLSDCLGFFKQYIPANGIQMSIYDEGLNAIINLAAASEAGLQQYIITKPVVIDREARTFIKEHSFGGAHIVNNPETHPVGRLMHQAMGKPDVSYLVLHLMVDGKKIGVVTLFAGGARYAQEHERLLSLLHEPFAVAFSNTLKHREVLRLKDLLADDNQYLNKQLHHIAGAEIIGEKFGLRDVMEMVKQVAPLSSQVLLLGETGVGKEVIANAIHVSSTRARGPFIKVNCGAIPDSLIDSELFGHEKGAFTGAIEQKRGRFERAHTGTIFLDEIGELPMAAQVRLLRVIQTKEIERVGGNKPATLDIRIIAATHRNLEEMIQSGQFREDLWFRLNVFPITIPPLRHRQIDIPALVHYFVERKTTEMNLWPKKLPTPKAIEKLKAYNWPGNVRELENVVERALIRSSAIKNSTNLIFDEPMKTSIPEAAPEEMDNTQEIKPLNSMIRQYIEFALKRTNGKVKGQNGAAALLNINPSTLRNRMDKLGIPYGRTVKQ